MVDVKRGRRGTGMAREIEKGREEELYISLACLPRPSVRSFGYGYARCGYIERPGGSHFQFNLLKARQKIIRYFTGAVDRASFTATAF